MASDRRENRNTSNNRGESRQSAAMKHVRRMQRQARAVLDAHGVKMFRAEVAALGAKGTVFLRRNSSVTADANGGAIRATDAKASVRLDGARRLKVGDWCWCLQLKGHAFVLGRVGREEDVYIDEISPFRGQLLVSGDPDKAQLLFKTTANANAVKQAWWHLNNDGFVLYVDRDGDSNSDLYALWYRGADGSLHLGGGAGTKFVIADSGTVSTPGSATFGGAVRADSFEPQQTWEDVLAANTSINITHTAENPRAFAWVLVAGVWTQLPYGAATAESSGCFIRSSSTSGVTLSNSSTTNRRLRLKIYR